MGLLELVVVRYSHLHHHWANRARPLVVSFGRLKGFTELPNSLIHRLKFVDSVSRVEVELHCSGHGVGPL